ncbi:predicted protein [Uncinocarpus reesii 1704]|uniref:AhpC/TSA antioxidant enzyme-domain-containing protein n=1 Tax=Uncinocarpus reesii (strain UAMH 1704) TaxID=336963 RepID=C4JLD9_UNCRE|nr:uncharacterized protein UREG_03647 [Uncinocarpus reesii 1704]EEP78801.1 predicted protein [Uncinocarpus reesii 1704]
MDKPLPSLPLDGQAEAQARASGSGIHGQHGDKAMQPCDAIPSQDVLNQSFRIPILDSDGKERLFGDLFDNSDSPEQKQVMVVFVRHFFCGSCQDYVQTLSSSIPSPASLPTGTSLVVIGCGATSLIPMYAKTTSCSFPIYTDPTSRLYTIFGMTRTWSLGPVPQYLQHSTLALVIKGITQGLRRTLSGDALKSGDMAQVGGEFLFKIGPEKKDSKQSVTVAWCHRMKTTRDHTEVPILKQIMGAE